MIELKRCSKCGEEKAATLEFFGPAKKRDGSPTLKSRCRPCHSAEGCARYHAKPETKLLQQRAAERRNASHKTCNKCGLAKPKDSIHFYSRRGAFIEHCKECDNKISKAWQSDNTEKVRAIKRRYYLENKTRIREKNDAWRDANRQRSASYKRRWAELNPEKMQTCRDNWARNYPERRRLSRKKWTLNNRDAARSRTRNYRARKIGADGRHSAEDVVRKYSQQNGRCYWCSSIVGSHYHVDHIIALARGGSDGPDNICISCPSCNWKKSKKYPWEFANRLL